MDEYWIFSDQLRNSKDIYFIKGFISYVSNFLTINNTNKANEKNGRYLLKSK